MGNHDDRASFRAAFPDHPVDAAGFVQSVCETPAGAFVLIDTLDPGADGGRLCPARLDWLEATLRELEGRPAFLAMHHPPVPLGIPILDSIALLEPWALSDLITRCEDVTIRYIFCGHVHRLTHGAWRGIPFSAQRSLICQFAATLAPKDDRIVGSYEHPAYSSPSSRRIRSRSTSVSFSTKARGSTSPIQRPATQEILLIFRCFRSSRGLGAICLSVLVFGAATACAAHQEPKPQTGARP